MANGTANLHLAATSAAEWSLSSQDKRRIKRLVGLVAAIILLLWLLHEVGQYIFDMGAERLANVHIDGNITKSIHVDGDWKRTVHRDGDRRKSTHVAPSGADRTYYRHDNSPKGSFANLRTVPQSGSGQAKTIGTNSGSEVSTDAAPNDNFQNVPASVAETGTQQPVSTVFGSGILPFIIPDSPPIPSSGSNGGAGDLGSGGNGSDGSNSGGGAESGGPAGNGGGDSIADGPDTPGGNPSGNLSVFAPVVDILNGGPGGDPSSNGGSGPNIQPFSTTIDPGSDSGVASAPIVEVPEPSTFGLIVVGLLALLANSYGRRYRCGTELLAAQEGSRGRRLIESHGSSARAAKHSPLRRIFVIVLAGVASLAFFVNPASAEKATVYGTTAGIFSKTPGVFLPANTDLTCFSMNDANCWDGKKWHRLYPSGRRHYAISATDRVACSVIVAPSNDCWTGSAWYRLPKGQVFGVIGGFFSNTPGAFITAPLQLPPGAIINAPRQSPTGEIASVR